MTVDLRTRYLGLELRSPIVASPSPLTGELDSALQLVAAGAAAIVLPSLFEEEIVHEEIELNRSLEVGADQFAEALDYFPHIASFAGVGDRYLARLRQIKAQAGVPVIASLNASTPGGWVRYAGLMEEAGADALELNLYHVAADPSRTAADMETRDLDLIAAVRDAISIPLAVKLSPYYSALASFARAAVERGADGLVLFNRFYQPDFDLETRTVESRLELSRTSEIRLPLLWISALCGRLDCSLAATTGVEGAEEALKYVMAGADAVMTTSSLLRHGEGHLRTILQGFEQWMDKHEFESVTQMKGSMSLANCAEPEAFVRANYLKMLQSYPGAPTLIES